MRHQATMSLSDNGWEAKIQDSHRDHNFAEKT